MSESKLLLGGDKLKVKAIADEGYYPKSLSYNGSVIATNNDSEKTELEGEITVASEWPRIGIPKTKLEVVPTFETAAPKIEPFSITLDTSRSASYRASVNFFIIKSYTSSIRC